MENESVLSAEGILDDLISRYPQLGDCSESIFRAASVLSTCFRSDGKVLVCGNGGSAADCEHIVAELMKGFHFKRPVDAEFAERYRQVNGQEAPVWLEGALPTLSLVSQTAFLTAFSNDESAIGSFAQQVYGYGGQGDVLLAISTSGSSANVIEATRVARAKGMKVVALTKEGETPLSSLSDVAICVPETATSRIQEYHLPVYHCLCGMLEAEFFGALHD